jgi:DNA-binding transcriptional MerR regulator/methylmalonyl-CoA mutase cobalamin-binding subunit
MQFRKRLASICLRGVNGSSPRPIERWYVVVPDPPPEVGAGLSIQEVSRLLGLPAPTLRSWELRYGIPATSRSAGGHRRYSADSLHQLRLMRDEIARGMRASDAARTVRRSLAECGEGAAHRADLLAAADRMDPAAVRAALDRAHKELGLAATLDQVLMPGMHQIGVWWQTGRCDVAQEHLATEVVRGWLSRVTAFAPPPTRTRPIVLACGPRDLHTVGLEALAALLAHRGHSCRTLGARTPQRSLVTAVTTSSAEAVVVVSHLPTHRRLAVDALRAVDSSGAAIFFAGGAFILPRARAGLPGTYLGESLSGAAGVIEAALG